MLASKFGKKISQKNGYSFEHNHLLQEANDHPSRKRVKSGIIVQEGV